MRVKPKPLKNPDVVAVVPNDDYTLLLTFANGEVKVYDMKPWIDKGVFRELQNPGYFRCVRLDGGGSIQWPHEQDVCPDTLYEKSVPVEELAEPFDYTKWRQNLFEGMTGREISNMAMERRRKMQETDE